MKEIHVLLLNTIALIIVLIFNSLGGSGSLSEYSVGDISNFYPTLITPASYAFGIWGVIYLLLALFIGFQWYSYFRRPVKNLIFDSFPWFPLSCFFNLLWILLWVNNFVFYSTIVIFLLLFCLIRLVLKYRLEVWDAPLKIIFFVWWPICIYFAWIILASVINVTVYLKSMEAELYLSETAWLFVMLSVSTLIYLLLIIKRNMREAAIVGAWGIFAVYINVIDSHPHIAKFILAFPLLLIIAASIHAFKNRKTLPFLRKVF
ncbi:MAG: hypothetical protein EA412_02910 [Chitinophagaceae bacterium]|nr:MAG: hypothetical protein EA412_02910 [Chitinophagaceae bacterium]